MDRKKVIQSPMWLRGVLMLSPPGVLYHKEIAVLLEIKAAIQLVNLANVCLYSTLNYVYLGYQLSCVPSLILHFFTKKNPQSVSLIHSLMHNSMIYINEMAKTAIQINKHKNESTKNLNPIVKNAS